MTNESQIQNVQNKEVKKEMKKFKVTAVSPKQDVVWLNKSQAGLIGVAFHVPPHDSSPFTLALVTLLWTDQTVFGASLIYGWDALRLDPPQGNVIAWSDAYKAKLQHDVCVAYRRWSNRDLNVILSHVTIRRWISK